MQHAAMFDKTGDRALCRYLSKAQQAEFKRITEPTNLRTYIVCPPLGVTISRQMIDQLAGPRWVDESPVDWYMHQLQVGQSPEHCNEQG